MSPDLAPPLSAASRTNPKAGEGVPRLHPLVQDGKFITAYDAKVATLYDCFFSSSSSHGDKAFLGTRAVHDGVPGDYTWLTYGQVARRVADLAAGLSQFGIPEKANVGLYSVNRLEWTLGEYACYCLNLVTVPLYDTLGKKSIEHICNQTEMKYLFASKDKIHSILKIIDAVPTIKVIISMDVLDDPTKEACRAKGLQCTYIGDVESSGSGRDFVHAKPKPSDLCTICYSSGTTGLPKGAMIPHSAMIADASACLALAGVGARAVKGTGIFDLGPDDVHISYLPLAHIFERLVFTALIAVGASIGYYLGDAQKLMSDLLALRPTVFCSVPRLLNKMYDKVMAGVREKGFLAHALFDYAYRTKLDNLHKRNELTHMLWDAVVFGKIRAVLGGRVKAMLSGAAPISPAVMDFLRVCFSCEVYEGYGSTETCAGSTLTVRGDWTSGHIGVPVPCNEVKLVDVPDMAYTSHDKPCPRGEICIRGPNCFVGYYKDEEKTREAIDQDGWVKTGDIGAWDERGRLKIIDRKKNLFKLAQGEYIAPEKVEMQLCKNPIIAQCFVHGDSLRSSLVALIVPDRDELCKWAQHNGVGDLDYNDLLRNDQVIAFFKDQLQLHGRRGSDELKGFEIPREILLLGDPFSVENDLLTPSFKVKRFEIQRRFKDDLDALMAKIKE